LDGEVQLGRTDRPRSKAGKPTGGVDRADADRRIRPLARCNDCGLRDVQFGLRYRQVRAIEKCGERETAEIPPCGWTFGQWSSEICALVSAQPGTREGPLGEVLRGFPWLKRRRPVRRA